MAPEDVHHVGLHSGERDTEEVHERCLEDAQGLGFKDLWGAVLCLGTVEPAATQGGSSGIHDLHALEMSVGDVDHLY